MQVVCGLVDSSRDRFSVRLAKSDLVAGLAEIISCGMPPTNDLHIFSTKQSGGWPKASAVAADLENGHANGSITATLQRPKLTKWMTVASLFSDAPAGDGIHVLVVESTPWNKKRRQTREVEDERPTKRIELAVRGDDSRDVPSLEFYPRHTSLHEVKGEKDGGVLGWIHTQA